LERLPGFSNNKLPFEAFVNFRKEYARATEIFEKIYGMSRNQVFYKVSENSKAWENYKICIKLVHLSAQDAQASPGDLRKLFKSPKVVELLQKSYCPPYETLKHLYDNCLTPV